LTEFTKTQEAILQSAKEHFLRYGFLKASLNRIVRDAGFTKGAFYGYYQSKEELFCALIGDTVDGVRAFWSRSSARGSDIPRESKSIT